MIRLSDLSASSIVSLFFEKSFERPPAYYIDSYVSDITGLTEEFDKLTRLSPKQFWSTVVYDTTCQNCIVKSLQNLPRIHEYQYLIPQFKFPIKAFSKILNSVLVRVISRREIKDKQTTYTNLEKLIDLNLFCDYCCVFGSNRDSEKILYSFVTWRENDLMEQISPFRKILIQSITECSQSARKIPITQNDQCRDSLISTYTLLCDILFVTYQMLNSDKRILDALVSPDIISLVRLSNQVFHDIIEIEIEIIRLFIIEKQITKPFFLSKILLIHIVKSIIDSTFTSNRASTKLVIDFKKICEMFLDRTEFAEHIDSSPSFSLTELAKKMSIQYPNEFKPQFKDKFVEAIRKSTDSSESIGPYQNTIKHLNELFPDYSSNFLSKVAEFYDGKTDVIVNRIFEDSLHPDLAELDRTDQAEKELTKKSVIPTGILYHKKAKPRAEDEIGRRKEQIFVNAIAKQYTYVVEEETITSPVEDTDKNSIAKEVNEVETDDHGATYRIHEGQYNDEYDDTYDDALEKNDIDPLNLQAARTRVKNESACVNDVILPNPNIRTVDENSDRSEYTDENISSRASSSASQRETKVSAPRAAYQRRTKPVDTNEQISNEGHRNKKSLNETSTKLEKRRKDVNKAKYANHNRKAMADKKRAKGMI